MARTRTIRPTFPDDFNLARVSKDCRLFLVLLSIQADDYGRVIDSPKALGGACFPHDDDITPDVVREWIDKLVEIGELVRYEAGGGRYLHMCRWSEENGPLYQKPPNPTPSKLPAPPQVSTGDFVEPTGDHGEAEESSVSVSVLVKDSVRDPVSVLEPAEPDQAVENPPASDHVEEEANTSTSGTDHMMQAVHRIIAVCTADDRGRVNKEAINLYTWAKDHDSLPILDDSLTFFERKASTPPVLPRAIADNVKGTRRKRGLRAIPDFYPDLLKRVS